MSGPLDSVGVPVYRGQDDLPVTLECLRTQSYQNLDVLISVDAGDQESARACEPFLRSDPRFRMQVQSSRLGWAGNTNWTMHQRRGEFYIFQQHDDQVSPSYIADLVQAAARAPNAAICFAQAHSSGVNNFVSRGFPLSGSSPVERALAYLETMDCVPFRGLIRSAALRTRPDLLQAPARKQFASEATELVGRKAAIVVGLPRGVDGGGDCAGRAYHGRAPTDV